MTNPHPLVQALGKLTLAQAMVVWHAVAAHVENNEDLCGTPDAPRDLDEARTVLDLLDEAVATAAALDRLDAIEAETSRSPTDRPPTPTR